MQSGRKIREKHNRGPINEDLTKKKKRKERLKNCEVKNKLMKTTFQMDIS